MTMFSMSERAWSASQDLGDASPKITGHEAIDHRIQSAVRVSQEEAIGQGIRDRYALTCEQFRSVYSGNSTRISNFVYSYRALGNKEHVRVRCRVTGLVSRRFDAFRSEFGK